MGLLPTSTSKYRQAFTLRAFAGVCFDIKIAKDMFSNKSLQLDFHSELLEDLVPKDHAYRKLLKLVDFESLAKGIKSIYSSNSGKKHIQ